MLSPPGGIGFAGFINETGDCTGTDGCPKGDVCVQDYGTGYDACCACALPMESCRFLLEARQCRRHCCWHGMPTDCALDTASLMSAQGPIEECQRALFRAEASIVQGTPRLACAQLQTPTPASQPVTTTV